MKSEVVVYMIFLLFLGMLIKLPIVIVFSNSGYGVMTIIAAIDEIIHPFAVYGWVAVFITRWDKKFKSLFLNVFLYVLLTVVSVWHIVFCTIRIGENMDFNKTLDFNKTISEGMETSTKGYGDEIKLIKGINAVLIMANIIVVAHTILLTLAVHVIVCGDGLSKVQAGNSCVARTPKAKTNNDSTRIQNNSFVATIAKPKVKNDSTRTQNNSFVATIAKPQDSSQTREILTLGVSDLCKGDLYHYTDAESATAIVESGQIKASEPKSGDTFLGRGVYFTPLPPSTNTDLILKNNYGTVRNSKRDRVQRAFRISANQLPGCKHNITNKRNVVVYPDSVDLQNVKYELETISSADISDSVVQ